MLHEVHEFTPRLSGESVLNNWLDACTFSRAVHEYLKTYEFDLGDEHSAVQPWLTAEGERRHAWCFTQVIGGVYVLRVYHLDGPAEQALEAPRALFRSPALGTLEAALDALDSGEGFPGAGWRDALQYIKRETEEQLYTLTLDDLEGNTVEDLQARHQVLWELLGYVNALGA